MEIRKKVLAAGLGLSVLATSAGVAAAAPSQQRPLELRYSLTSDRLNQIRLAGSTVENAIFVSLEGRSRLQVKSATFHLDGGEALRTEAEYPFDFAGGNWDSLGSARPFDTTALTNGRHVISADVVTANGRTKTVKARFTVANKNAGGGATSTTLAPTSSTTAKPAVTSTTAAPVTSTTAKPVVTSTTAKPPATSTTTAAPSTGTQQKNCIPKPSACGYPDATNTGWQHTGVVLKPSGSITVTTPGTVIDGLDVKGSITVKADNVTIKRSRITSGDYYPIAYDGYKGLLVEDTEIAGTSYNVTAGISFENYTARRVNVHGSADGLKANANVLIEDSYIHDLAIGPDTHNDAIQSTGGSNVTIRHNSVLVGDPGVNACLQLGNEWGPVSNLTVTNNLFDGGGWVFNMGPNGTNRVFTNNRFGHSAGYGIGSGGQMTWTGNVWDDTLLAAK